MAIVGEYVQSGESSMPCVKAHVSVPSFTANGDVVFRVDTGAPTTVLLPGSMKEPQIKISLWRWLWWFANSRLYRAQGMGRALYGTVDADLTFQDAEGGTRSHTVKLDLYRGGPKVGRSLLGRDVLNGYRCTLNASKDHVSLESALGSERGSPLTEAQYRELFEELGIAARQIAHTLRWRGKSMRCYFNRNHDVGIYFTANPNDAPLHPEHLWERVEARRVKQKDGPLLNVRPLSGRDLVAFHAFAREWEA